MKFKPKVLQKRVWIEGFRLKATDDNKIIAKLMNEWKRERQRPTHFTRAIKLYVSLLENDLDTFFEVLIEFAPRLAFRLMQQQPPSIPERQSEIEKPARPKAKPLPAPKLEETQPSGESQADDLLSSLGLDDIEF